MDNDRKKKIFLLRILVAVTAIVVFSFWLLNLKKEIKVTEKTINNEASEDLENMQNDFRDVIESLNNKIDSLNNKLEEKNVKEENEKTNEEIVDVLETATSTPIFNEDNSAASGSSTESIVCPDYINCMPTIDMDPRSCFDYIPSGCEDITQIVY